MTRIDPMSALEKEQLYAVLKELERRGRVWPVPVEPDLKLTAEQWDALLRDLADVSDDELTGIGAVMLRVEIMHAAEQARSPFAARFR